MTKVHPRVSGAEQILEVSDFACESLWLSQLRKGNNRNVVENNNDNELSVKLVVWE